MQSCSMLDLIGKKYGGKKMDPGLSRRDVFRIGSIGVGGQALPELLRAEKFPKNGPISELVG